MQDAPHSASHNSATFRQSRRASKPKTFDELDPERKAEIEACLEEIAPVSQRAIPGSYRACKDDLPSDETLGVPTRLTYRRASWAGKGNYQK